MAAYVNLAPSDPAPWFHQRSGSNPNFAFDTAAGRYIVLCFLAGAVDAQAGAALASVEVSRAASSTREQHAEAFATKGHKVGAAKVRPQRKGSPPANGRTSRSSILRAGCQLLNRVRAVKAKRAQASMNTSD